MAIELVSPGTPTTKFSVDLLDDASTDLSVADALLLSVEHFVDEIRDFTMPKGGIRPDEHIFGPALTALTLLGELRDKIQEAKATIDHAVTAAIRDQLPRFKSDVQ